MPEVHLPRLEEDVEEDTPSTSAPAPASPATPVQSARTHAPAGRSVIRIALEVVLIALGVFLGLAGEQWRENAEHRQQADASLRRFRAEIQTNRESLARVMDYHVATREHLVAYLAIDPGKRNIDTLRIEGLQPASFQRASWDLALVNQSLAYIDPELVLVLSRIYTEQEAYLVKTAGITQAMYLQPPRANGLRFPEPLLAAMAVYYDDLVVIEPALLKLYDQVLVQVDKELSES